MPSLARLRALLAQDSDGTAAVLNLHRFTLSFPDPLQERGFLRSRLRKLRASVFLSAVVGIIVNASILAVSILVKGRLERGASPTDAASDFVKVNMIGVGSIGCISLMLAAGARARCLGTVALEWFTVIAATLAMCTAVFSRNWYACKMTGQEPNDVWRGTRQHTDSSLLLTIDFIVTATHLVLPVRWIVLLPMEVLGIGLYTACVAIGSPEDTAVANLALLVGLIAMAAIGKRTMEINERCHFAQVARERVMRCNAEFQLSRLQSSQPARRGSDSESEGSVASAPTTTNTGRLFELEEGADIHGQLQAISTFGQEKHWLLDKGEVDLLPDRVLGRGGFGLVLTGLFCGTPVAVKLVLERHGDAVMRRVASLANELRILLRLRHPNIVFIYGAVVDVEQQRVGLVLELVQGQTVKDFMGNGPRGHNLPDLSSRYQVCLGVCRAFVYLHSRRPPIVHGDLKSANVFVEGSGRSTRAKVLDFGLARVLTRNAQSRGGTWTWMAPEMFRRAGQRLRCSADIFSLGMLMHFVATRTHPRAGMNRSLVKQMLRTAQPVSLEWPPDAAFQPRCRPLIESCLQVDEQLRPSAVDVHEAVSSWPNLGEFPALACDEANAPAPSRAKRWNEGVQDLAKSHAGVPRSGRAERAPGSAQSEEPPLPPAAQQPFEPLQRPNRLAMVEEEERRPELGGEPAAVRPRAERSLLVPSLRPTEDRVMLATAAEVCTRWNYKLPRDCCCGFHAGVALLQKCCRSLDGMACETHFDPTGARQCQQCGLLAWSGAAAGRAQACSFCALRAVDTMRRPAVARPQREQL